MFAILSLLVVFLLLDVAVLAGWAPSTRDGRDWTVPEGESRPTTHARTGW